MRQPQSATVTPNVPAAPFAQAMRLRKAAPHNSLILERYLAGAEVFAETLMRRAPAAASSL